MREEFRASAVPLAYRLTYWNEFAASTFGWMQVEQRPRVFDGKLRLQRFGDLALIDVRSSAARLSGGLQAADSALAAFFVLLNLAGTPRLQQQPQETSLSPCDIKLLRADEPYCIDLKGDNRSLIPHVPRRPDMWTSNRPGRSVTAPDGPRYLPRSCGNWPWAAQISLTRLPLPNASRPCSSW